MKKSLCCISLKLQEKGHISGTMTRKKYRSMSRTDALQSIGSKIVNNLVVLQETIKYCYKNNWNLRIGSDLLPLITLTEAIYTISDLPQKNIINELFDTCGKLIKSHNIRCSMHPDQFVVLASTTSQTASTSILELDKHAHIMNLLGLPSNYYAPINIHMNNFKNRNLDDVTTRFINNYNKLQPSTRQRLTVECEDKKNSWNTRLLYDKLYTNIGIPITYDSHHHRLNDGGLSPTDAYKLAKSTWGSCIPLFHFSNGRASATDNSHSDYVNNLHDELFDGSVDVEFEFKGKDLALLKFEEEFENKSV